MLGLILDFSFAPVKLSDFRVSTDCGGGEEWKMWDVGEMARTGLLITYHFFFCFFAPVFAGAMMTS
jgi:hypothetical protein